MYGNNEIKDKLSPTCFNTDNQRVRRALWVIVLDGTARQRVATDTSFYLGNIADRDHVGAGNNLVNIDTAASAISICLNTVLVGSFMTESAAAFGNTFNAGARRLDRWR